MTADVRFRGGGGGDCVFTVDSPRQFDAPARLNLFGRREKKLESKTSREIRERENSREAAKRLKLGDKNVKMKSATLPILSRGLREFAAGPFPSFFFFLSSPPRGKSGTVCVAAVDVLLNKKKLPRSFY